MLRCLPKLPAQINMGFVTLKGLVGLDFGEDLERSVVRGFAQLDTVERRFILANPKKHSRFIVYLNSRSNDYVDQMECSMARLVRAPEQSMTLVFVAMLMSAFDAKQRRFEGIEVRSLRLDSADRRSVDVTVGIRNWLIKRFKHIVP